MNKTELVDSIAQHAGLTKADSAKALSAVLLSISTALKNKERVQLVDFGTFQTKVRSARKCRNPSTGVEMLLPECLQVAFKPGKALKELVNEEEVVAAD